MMQTTMLLILALSCLSFGWLVGCGCGRYFLWRRLKKNKADHEKLELRYDPDKREMSLNGTHRVKVLVLTKGQLEEMLDEVKK